MITFQNKTSELDGFTGEFYPIFKVEILILSSLFQKTEEGLLPNSCYESIITLISKPQKTIQEKKVYSNNSHEHRWKQKKEPQQNIGISSPTMYKK